MKLASQRARLDAPRGDRLSALGRLVEGPRLRRGSSRGTGRVLAITSSQ